VKKALLMTAVATSVLLGSASAALAGSDLEPNNSVEQASPLAAIDTVNGYLTYKDEDHYKIAPAATSGYRTITVTGVTGVFPLITLRDPAMSFVKVGMVPIGQPQAPVSIRFYANAGQTYILTVAKDDYRSISAGAYYLNMKWS